MVTRDPSERSAATPRRRRVGVAAVVHCIAVLLACSVSIRSTASAQATTSPGQGSVRGSVALLERGGVKARDVAYAVVYLDAPGRPVNERREAHARAEIDMRRREFDPHVQVVRVGGTVTFPNSDPFSHNAFSNTALGAFDLGLYRSGVTRGHAFDRAGVYAIYCNIHARMVSFVVAVNTPWVAMVASDGSFTIPAVPPGTYRLHAWHERTQEVVQHVIVGPTGSSGISITLDARGYVAKPHQNKFGAPYALTRADRY